MRVLVRTRGAGSGAAEGGRDVLHHFFFAGAAFAALDAFLAAFFAIAVRGGEG